MLTGDESQDMEDMEKVQNLGITGVEVVGPSMRLPRRTEFHGQLTGGARGVFLVRQSVLAVPWSFCRWLEPPRGRSKRTTREG